jgi:hypothetical protein
MLHYFVDMQNKTPQALIDQAQKWRKAWKMLKMFLCGRNIDCLDYWFEFYFKNGNLALIDFDKGGGQRT